MYTAMVKVILVLLLRSQSTASMNTTVFPIPVTIDFKEQGVATNAIGFEESDLVVNGGTLSDFTKVSDSKYTVNVYPSDIPTSVTVRLPAESVLGESGEPVGEASVNVNFSSEKQLSYTSVTLNKGVSAGNVSALSDGYIPKGHNKGDAWNSGKYLAVGNDVDFTFDFDKIYSFSKVRLDYQEWNAHGLPSDDDPV